MNRAEKLAFLNSYQSFKQRSKQGLKNLSWLKQPDGKVIYTIDGVEVSEEEWWLIERLQYFSEHMKSILVFSQKKEELLQEEYVD